MNQKNISAESTFIFQGDSSFNSLGLSHIKPIQIHQNDHKLKVSNSLEYFKNPYQQAIPLKLPKRRLRKQTHSHILVQTQPISYRTCIKTSQLRNKQLQQKTWKKQKGTGQFFTNQYETRLIQRQYLHQKNTKSLQFKIKPIFSSPDKTSKKHFNHNLVNQSAKNPILIGEQPKIYTNAGLERFTQNEKARKEKGQALNLQWKTNKNKQKQQFLNKINANQNKKSIIKAKQTAKIQKPLQSSRKNDQKQRTYKDLYMSRKRFLENS